MKSILFFTGLVLLLALQSCTTTRRFGTTVERDENNPCQINIVIQVECTAYGLPQ